MIDPKITALFNDALPPLNRELLDGIPGKQLVSGPQYIDVIWRSAAESFPPGLTYDGPEECTPLEMFRELVRSPKPFHAFELTPNSLYFIKYKFSLNGHPLKQRYILHPFATHKALLYLNGTQYRMTPVLGGRVLNIEKGKVYLLPGGRSRTMFDKVNGSFIKNNQHGHCPMVYALMYNMPATERSKAVRPTLVHYCLAKYGLSGMFKTMFNKNVTVGLSELDDLVGKGSIVFRSSGVLARGNKLKIKHSQIRIALSADEYSEELDQVFAAVFYILDNSGITLDVLDVEYPDAWLRLLPPFLFKSLAGNRNRVEEMVNHLNGVELSMDTLTIKELKSIAIPCENIFDLFKYMILKFNNLVGHHDPGNLFNLELGIIKPLYYEVVYNIFKTMFALKKLSGDRVTAEKINSVFNENHRTNRIKTTSGHSELTPESIATDCKPFSLTTHMLPQSKVAASTKKGSKAAAANPLHPSAAAVCSLRSMTKSETGGIGRANPMLKLSSNFVVLESSTKDLEELYTLFKPK